MSNKEKNIDSRGSTRTSIMDSANIPIMQKVNEMHSTASATVPKMQLAPSTKPGNHNPSDNKK